jgi:hypothetical protein
MSKALAAYPLWLINAIVSAPAAPWWLKHLLLDDPRGCVIVAEAAPGESFEAWLLARSLVHIRSEAFRESTEYEMLMAEWERSR